MANRVPLVLILLAAATLCAGAAPDPLAAERWKTRPLVVVAPGRADKLALATQQALAQPATRAAFADRQVVVFELLDGQGSREGQPIAPAAAEALLHKLGLRADGPAMLLLIGKDGGVKLRRRSLNVAEILDTIDAMPMRRSEVKG
jgi:hypothetical protein